MNKISLTASMRSNLLSLQNISKQVDSTQNKLSTGKKVNSAIDNPSSYYTARSLTNRASDLDALLDSMGQAVSTIKAATEALESAADFLEQAKAVAAQAQETAQPIVAHVSTEDELFAAINSGKQGLIVLDNDISISANQTLELKEGQSLVGAGYLDGSGNKTKLLFDIADTKDFAFKINSNSMLSNLEIGNETSNINVMNLIHINNAQNVILQDLKINWKTNINARTSIYTEDSSVKFLGSVEADISIVNTTNYGARFLKTNNSTITVDGNLKIITNGDSCHGLDIEIGSVLSIINKSQIHMEMKGSNSKGFIAWDNGTINICDEAVINIKTLDEKASGIYLSSSSGTRPNQFNISDSSKVNIWTTGNADGIQKNGDGNTINVNNNAQLNVLVEGTTAVGTQIPITQKDDAQVNIVAPDGTSGPATADLADKISADWDAQIPEAETGKQNNTSASQYTSIISQYDSLIKNASYKGVNLLQEQDLKVTFNEGRTSWLDVIGKDASSAALGLTTLEWNSKADVEKSIEELTNAMNQIRSMSSELGSYYNIVTTRQDFTENLINILEEGADKLTLADMNEESANMLALQTRQQLAVNSLSLASQAAQSILKLF